MLIGITRVSLSMSPFLIFSLSLTLSLESRYFGVARFYTGSVAFSGTGPRCNFLIMSLRDAALRS